MPYTVVLGSLSHQLRGITIVIATDYVPISRVKWNDLRIYIHAFWYGQFGCQNCLGKRRGSSPTVRNCFKWLENLFMLFSMVNLDVKTALGKKGELTLIKKCLLIMLLVRSIRMSKLESPQDKREIAFWYGQFGCQNCPGEKGSSLT